MIFVGLVISGGIWCLIGGGMVFLNGVIELCFLEKFGRGEKMLWGRFWVLVLIMEEGGFLKFLLIVKWDDFWRFRFVKLVMFCVWDEWSLVVFFFLVGIFLVVSFIVLCGLFLVLRVNVFCKMEILLLFKYVFF